jgi:nicotinamidase-related amidase
VNTDRTLSLPCRYYRMYPPGRPLGYTTEDVSLNLAETVFLIVDVYGLGFDEDGQLGEVDEFYSQSVCANRDIVVNHIRPAKLAAKALGLAVVYLCNYLAPSTTAENEWRKMSLRTMNIDVLEAWQEPNDVLRHSRIIAPDPDDYFIKKQHYSGFFETHLESLLKELGARTLVTVGFDAQICLRGTVTDALYRNYRVIVLRDGISTGEFPETEAGQWSNFLAVRFIETAIGYTATTEDFVRACQAASQGSRQPA